MTVPEFGATPWGHGWRRVAEPTTLRRPDPALPRARSLARSDRVGVLELHAGRVTARVDDRADHDVLLTFPTWSNEEVARARPMLEGVGAAHDLPDELHGRLTAAGLAVAPAAGEVAGECSCTARRRPCIHVLAFAFEVARRLDERPALALALRGAEVETAPVTTTARIPLTALDPAGFYDSGRAAADHASRSPAADRERAGRAGAGSRRRADES